MGRLIRQSKCTNQMKLLQKRLTPLFLTQTRARRGGEKIKIFEVEKEKKKFLEFFLRFFFREIIRDYLVSDQMLQRLRCL